MTAVLTQEVTERLTGDHYCWLTTVAKSGRPVPKLVWFLLDGTVGFSFTLGGIVGAVPFLVWAERLRRTA